MSMAAAHLWHKPSERAAWMRRFVIVSDSSIRIYGTRNDHEQHNDPMYYIELLTSTDLINGSDNIIKQGWLVKKGKIKWNPRWCALVKYGYLNYIDPDQKQGIRCIDISNAEFQTEKSHNLIQWKNDKGEWFQFRCDSASIQKNWHQTMVEIQKNCLKIRKENEKKNSLNKEPTLFAFTVRKLIHINDTGATSDDGTEDNRGIKSNRYEQHYFCTDNNQYLEGWKKCITEQIHSSTTTQGTDRRHNRQESIYLRKRMLEKRLSSADNNGSLNAKESSIGNDNNTPRKPRHSASTISTWEFAGKLGGSIDDQDFEYLSDGEIDEKMTELMEKLKIPQQARPKMLKLDTKHKIQMLQQHALKEKTKRRQSGRQWSDKFASYKQTNISTLQQFSVVLRDETDEFVKDFIENLGLNHLCRLATKSPSSSKTRGKSFSAGFDSELLRVMKAIIDTNENSLKSLVEHNLSIRIIVEKIDSEDIKVSELALSLLVTMVGIDNDEISILASNKILTGLKDLALSKGQRNKYKVLISHMSIKDVLNGSFQYDTYTLTLINYLIMGLDQIHYRMDERRLLNSLQFDKILNKLEDRTRRKQNFKYSSGYSLRDALINQIETYRKLYEDDRRIANSQRNRTRKSAISVTGGYEEDANDTMEWEMMDFDIDNPQDLFKRVHDQALQDGYINELTSILKNLVVLPSNAERAWYNVSKIVNAACKPTFNAMIDEYNEQQTDENDKIRTIGDGGGRGSSHTKSSSIMSSVIGGVIRTQNFDENYVSQSNIDTQYPTYDQLHTMLEIREAQSTDDSMSQANQIKQELQNELNEAREKQLKLEDALLEEKNKNLNLSTQVAHFLKFGTQQQTNQNLSAVPLQQQSSNSSTDSYVVVAGSSTEKKEDKPADTTETAKDPKAAMMAMIAAKKGGGGGGNGGNNSKPTTSAPAADDKLNKYRKMIKFKMPKNSIINRMRQDGIDANIIEHYEENGSLPGGNALGTANTNNGSNIKPAGNDPKAAMLAMIAAKSGKGGGNKISADDEKALSKYKRMQKMNIPKQSVINRMRQDKCSPRLIGLLFPDAPEGKAGGGAGGAAGKPNIAAMILKKKQKEKPKLPPNLKPKKVIKPNNKMRNLHWTTVNPFDVEKTIWNNIDDSRIQFDIKDLESKFCWKQIERKEDDKNKKEVVKPKNDIVRVIDTRRAYNIEIFLGRLKVDPWTLREAMLSMNETKLSLDTIHKLINFVPTTEEAAQLNGYENEKNLGVAENFVKIIRTVDANLVERLTLWEFKIEFDTLYKEEQSSLVWLRNGHDSIQKSKRLKLMFALILSIGNYMNGSTSKGQAYGFKLSSLTQLMRSRTVDNSCTLMEYIYEFAQKNQSYKDAINFTKDLESLDEATTVDISVLRTNINQIGMKLRRIKKRIDSFNDKKSITRMGDNFFKMMKPFYSTAIRRFEHLEKLRDTIFNDLKELGVWLNEPKDANFKYLKTLNEFRENFLRSIKLTQQRKAKLAEIEKRKKWKENKSKKKRSSKKKRKSLQKKNGILPEDISIDLKEAGGDKENTKKTKWEKNKKLCGAKEG